MAFLILVEDRELFSGWEVVGDLFFSFVVYVSEEIFVKIFGRSEGFVSLCGFSFFFKF